MLPVLAARGVSQGRSLAPRERERARNQASGRARIRASRSPVRQQVPNERKRRFEAASGRVAPRRAERRRSRASAERRLAAADQLYDLQNVPLGQRERAVSRFGHDLAVALDGTAGDRDFQALEQVRDRGALRHRKLFAVDLNVNLSVQVSLRTGNLNSVEPIGDATRMTAAEDPGGNCGTGKETGQPPSAPVVP